MSISSHKKTNKFITFQCKILHRILSTKSKLFKLRIKEPHLCSLCNETKENILHVFWDCTVAENILLNLLELIENKCNITVREPRCFHKYVHYSGKVLH